jgi:Ca2+-binding EF-hand superfamily protein
MNKILLSTIILTFLSPMGLFANDAKVKRFKKSFDKNSDGKVTLEEYVSVRAKWGKSEAKSKKIFKYHDKNKDGSITLEEFLASK